MNYRITPHDSLMFKACFSDLKVNPFASSQIVDKMMNSKPKPQSCIITCKALGLCMSCKVLGFEECTKPIRKKNEAWPLLKHDSLIPTTLDARQLLIEVNYLTSNPTNTSSEIEIQEVRLTFNSNSPTSKHIINITQGFREYAP